MRKYKEGDYIKVMDPDGISLHPEWKGAIGKIGLIIGILRHHKYRYLIKFLDGDDFSYPSVYSDKEIIKASEEEAFLELL